jgi:8-oxo-dGTP pyrophosphatase MutT (NUDIX family)
MERLYEGAVATRALDGATAPADNGRMGYRDRQFWQPDVTVATVVVREGKLLCVEERVNGHVVINQPAGHLEPDESLVDAALRETAEETGWDVRLSAFIGAYQWKAPAQADGSGGRHYLRFAFAAEPLALDDTRRLDEGIVRALWLTPAELMDATPRHRSPLVWQVVADYLAGRRHPLSMLQQLA